AAAGAADPDAGRVHAAVPEGRAAARADPAIPAVVPLGLLGEPLEEAAHELRPLLGGELGERLRVAQPGEDFLDRGVAERALDAAKDAGEHAVVGVEPGLALHEAGAAEVVEAEQARSVQPGLERAEERVPFVERDRDALGAQPVEKVEEHRVTAGSAARALPSGSGGARPRPGGARARRHPAPS